MTLPSLCLDDRTYDQLLSDARDQLRASCPEWSDASPSDPGMVLLELFAYLTDQLIYRVNRLPDKVYVEFLRLMGVTLTPPAAAHVRLTFTRATASDQVIAIPRGTRVAGDRADSSGDAPVFITMHDAAINAGASEVLVEAAHGQLIEGEMIGVSDGSAGQRFAVAHAPIVLPSGDALDLVIAVEVSAEELRGDEPAILSRGVRYRLWREVEDFTGHAPDAKVYIVDRMAGEIQFAPSARLRDASGRLKARAEALAGIPPAKRRIIASYRSGGGPSGNVLAGRLKVLKDAIPGISVVNREAAVGGAAAEDLANALIRGPGEFYSLKRAVTATDYELVACRTGAASRAKAFASAELYRFAQPGTVEVLLVPPIGADAGANERVRAESLRARQSSVACQTVADALAECRPLGSACVVHWAPCKTVQVRMRVVVQDELDTAAVKADILAQLHARINPLPVKPYLGWEFGEALRASHLYDLVLAKPGVRYVDQLVLVVDEVPEARVATISADAFHPRTWYAAAADRLFITQDDGDGWQLLGAFQDERVALIASDARQPGLLAVVAHLEAGSHVLTSSDGGASWVSRARTAFSIAALAWAQRDGVSTLFLATDVGLYELAVQEGAVPIQILVDPAKQDMGFYSVVVHQERGLMVVMVAATSLGGIFISSKGGAVNSFQSIGLSGEDVRVLAVAKDGPRAFLWAGLAAVGNENGKGCLCCELRNDGQLGVEGWRWANKGWNGGSVHALAFSGQQVFAASHRSSMLILDASATDPVWQVPGVDCGLPLRDVGRLHPVDAIAIDPRGSLLMAGGIQGMFRSAKGRGRFETCSRREFTDKVTIPATSLLISGDHQIEVQTADDAQGEGLT